MENEAPITLVVDLARLRRLLARPPKPEPLQMAERAVRKARIELDEFRKLAMAAHAKDRDADAQKPGPEARQAGEAEAAQQKVLNAAIAARNERREPYRRTLREHRLSSKSERQQVYHDVLNVLEKINDLHREEAKFEAGEDSSSDLLISASPRLAAFVRNALGLIDGDWR